MRYYIVDCNGTIHGEAQTKKECELILSDRFSKQEIESLELEIISDTPEKWYAVQRTSEDAWDNGSFDYDEAVEMLKEQGEGLIAVINEETKFCEAEIYYNDVIKEGE